MLDQDAPYYDFLGDPVHYPKDFDFFGHINDKVVDKFLELLRSRLPAKCTKYNYQLSKKMLKLNWKTTEETLQYNLQMTANVMLEHLLVSKPIKVLTVSHVPAGQFQRIDDLNCIYINGDLQAHNYLQKVGILAHEIAHYFLLQKYKLFLTNNDENELLTEITAIYIGFGLLMLEGYEEVRTAIDTRVSGGYIETDYRTSKVGYIKPKHVRSIIAKTAYIRKQNPMWILKNVSWGNWFYLYPKLYALIKDYRKKRNT